MPCNGCKYWNPLSTDAGVKDRIVSIEGECRRHAPLPGQEHSVAGRVHARWPTTMRDDWCGDFSGALPGHRLARKEF